MNKKNIELKSLNFGPLFKKFSKRFGRHAIFAVMIIILLAYLLVVFKISSLAKAEPGPDQEVTVTSAIPKVDKNAVNQIQSLEQSNTQVHSLFEQARNNPFQE
jgi:predicted PurR-regulated permease PerM